MCYHFGTWGLCESLWLELLHAGNASLWGNQSLITLYQKKQTTTALWLVFVELSNNTQCLAFNSICFWSVSVNAEIY